MNPIPPDPKTVIAAVKSLRKNITFEAETLKALPKTRETSLALTKLEEGCMWLGKELQRIGDLFPDLLKDPYPTSKEPSVSTIDPPAAEVANTVQTVTPEQQAIATEPGWLKRLREEHAQLAERIAKLSAYLATSPAVDPDTARLLPIQLVRMVRYYEILQMRVDIADGKTPAPLTLYGEEQPTPKNPNLTVPNLPICGALTDQQFDIIKRALRGEAVPAEEYAAVSGICAMMIWADAAGLRVMASEDFAAVKSLIAKSRLELSTPRPDTAARVLSHLGDAKVLLDAWTPPGR